LHCGRKVGPCCDAAQRLGPDRGDPALAVAHIADNAPRWISDLRNPVGTVIGIGEVSSRTRPHSLPLVQRGIIVVLATILLPQDRFLHAAVFP
jgi:hypothetical protein